MIPFLVKHEDALAQLNRENGCPFTVVMKHGTLQVEYFSPKGTDTQHPHQQDELYIIASGESDFLRDGELVHCKAGDVLFVPALMEHRFIDFSPDFATWVVFYGPPGGERS